MKLIQSSCVPRNSEVWGKGQGLGSVLTLPCLLCCAWGFGLQPSALWPSLASSQKIAEIPLPCCVRRNHVAKFKNPRHSDTQTCGKHKRLGPGLRSCGEKMPLAGIQTPISPSSIAGPQARQDFKRVSWAPKNVQLLTWISCPWKLLQPCHTSLAAYQQLVSHCP